MATLQEPVAQPPLLGLPTGNYHPVDKTGTSLGTQANPVATNQVVGTPVYNSNTAAAALQCQATLPGDNTGKTTYINGFAITAHAPTANVQGTATVSLDGGTTQHLNFIFCESSTIGGMLQIEFPDPLPATKPNTSIIVTLPAITGGAVSAVSVYGYQL